MNGKGSQINIEVENLRRVFESKQNKVVALDGVSLQVRQGEIFGILGPNGAGKTTMIRILSTLLLPTSGRARVMGFDVANEAEKVRSVISMASGAERAGYDYISARGNLWFFSQLYGIPSEEAHRRIRELSKMLGLDENLDKKFYTLSTGYRQRVTIVRAFVNDPKVVFLDEPTIGLDVMTAMSIREFLVNQAKERGRTTLFPVTVLPWPLSAIADVLPYTEFISAARIALIPNTPGSYLYYLGLSFLGGMVLLAIGLIAYRSAEEKARRLGVVDRKAV